MGSAALGVRAMAFAALVGGCGYTSQYIPPVDGRARAVWDDDHVTMVVSEALSASCREAVIELVKEGPSPGGSPTSVEVEAYWVPRIVGPPVILVDRHGPVLVPAPPLLLPWRVGHHDTGGGHGSPGGSDGDLGKGALVLAAVALAVLPVVDVAMALGRPEDVDSSQLGIATTNAYNDLARQTAGACALAFGSDGDRP